MKEGDYMVDFNESWEETKKDEGFYSDDPDDAGGKTTWGITEATAKAHGWTGDMKDLPEEIAKNIAKTSYWIPMKCEQIDNQKIANEMFDIGFNIGTKRGTRVFQLAINMMLRKENVNPGIKIDGSIGKLTIYAYNSIEDKTEFLLHFMLLRINWYKNNSKSKFMRGLVDRAMDVYTEMITECCNEKT